MFSRNRRNVIGNKKRVIFAICSVRPIGINGRWTLSRIMTALWEFNHQGNSEFLMRLRINECVLHHCGSHFEYMISIRDTRALVLNSFVLFPCCCSHRLLSKNGNGIRYGLSPLQIRSILILSFLWENNSVLPFARKHESPCPVCIHKSLEASGYDHNGRLSWIGRPFRLPSYHWNVSYE